MNKLNQIIIEGEIITSSFENACVPAISKLRIKNTKVYNSLDGKQKEEETYVSVLGYGNLGIALYQTATAYKDIRVVGRLSIRNGKLVIIAEHADFLNKRKEK